MARKEYQVHIHATPAGLRELFVFPPLNERLEKVLHQALQHRAEQLAELTEKSEEGGFGLKGRIHRPHQAEHDNYGLGTQFLITNCYEAAFLRLLGQHAVNVLSQATGTWPSISHELDLPEEALNNQPLFENVAVSDKYL